MSEDLRQDGEAETAQAAAVRTESVEAAPVWQQLRVAREARGVSIHEVAQHLKFAPKQIEAMEAGRIERLPGIAFARGFLRNYARYLEIDSAPFLAALSETTAARDQAVPRQAQTLGRMPRGGSADQSSRWALFVSVAALAIAVAGWHFGWLEPRDEAALEEALSTDFVGQASAPALEESAPPPAITASMPVAEVSAPVALAQSAPAAIASEPAASLAPVAMSGQQQLTLSFSGESWVEVRDGTGEVLFSRVSQAGTTQEVQGRGPFNLIIGNAQKVALRYNGRSVDLEPHTRVTVARLKLE